MAGPLSFRIRRYRYQLLFIGIFLFFLYHYGSRGQDQDVFIPATSPDLKEPEILNPSKDQEEIEDPGSPAVETLIAPKGPPSRDGDETITPPKIAPNLKQGKETPVDTDKLKVKLPPDDDIIVDDKLQDLAQRLKEDIDEKKPTSEADIADMPLEDDLDDSEAIANQDADEERASSNPEEEWLITDHEGPFDMLKYELVTNGRGVSRSMSSSNSQLLPAVKIPRKEHFPVSISDLKKLPQSAKTIAKIQSKPDPETVAESVIRRHRLQLVKDAFLISWNQYKKYAWGHDEVLPKSLKAVDPFLGWAATLVDALDTLLIMGLDSEFKEALVFVETIDFTRSFKSTIPLFETVIRYLGGLIAAYDLTDPHEPILLKKAVELADNLLGAFDTPNRMPVTYFDWSDSATKFKYRAGTDSVFSEVASLSVEFTRLAQITGNNSYYDAVARITDALYELAPRTKIPGLFPTLVDFSGCKLEQYIRRSTLNNPLFQLGTAVDRAKGRRPPGALAGKSTEQKKVDEISKAAEDKVEKKKLKSAKLREEALKKYENDEKISGSHVENVVLGGVFKEKRAVIPSEEESPDGYPKRPSEELIDPDEEVDEEVYPSGRKDPAKKDDKDDFWESALTADGSVQVSPKSNPKSENKSEKTKEKTKEKKPGKSKQETGKSDQKSLKSQKKEEVLSLPLYHDVLIYNNPSSNSLARCVEQPLQIGASSYSERYTMGGLSDSSYEYFLKQHILLNGGEPKYEKLYRNMARAAIDNLTFRPLAEGDPDILFVGNKISRSNTDNFVEDNEMSHLACFTGGMFAMGGKVFGSKEDLEVGIKLAKGCVWAYNITRSGVMPENFHIQRCPTQGKCHFDPSAFLEAGSTLKEYVEQTIRQLEDVTKDDDEVDDDGKISKRDTLSSYPTRPLIREIDDDAGGKRWGYNGFYDQPRSFIRQDPRYILRPEALESVFYLFRITGDRQWQQDGWNMIESILKLTQVKDSASGNVIGYSAVNDVTDDRYSPYQIKDEAESFWMAETLKYAYLLFTEPDVISLDNYVFNTEAHPFKRQK